MGAYASGIGHVTRCQICSHNDLALILSLGHQPLVHGHLTKDKLHQPEQTYPLNWCRCSRCGLVQLDYIVDPSTVFAPDYPYFTGMTNMLIRNFRSLCDRVMEQYRLTDKDLVVDIGSNDGSLLQGFKEKGIRVVGVEPTNVADVANQNGIPTIKEFFTRETVARITADHGKAKLVTATNVFAHIIDVIGLTEAIRDLLTDDGVFISESQYLMDIVEKMEFDTIYDEHLRFYSLKPLLALFRSVGMSVADAERITAAGGSIRVYAVRGERPLSARAQQIIAEEEKKGLYDEATFKDFATRAIAAKHALLALTLACKQKGRIYGIGAPARGSTLLNFSNIDHHILDYACERKGSPKIGLFTPRGHIPVVYEERLFSDQPEFAFIVSWHIGEELMKKIRLLGFKGTFIMPLPEPRLVTA